MEDLLQHILLFIIGTVFVVGGVVFSIQALDSMRGIFQGIIFGMSFVVFGLYLLAWTFIGLPTW